MTEPLLARPPARMRSRAPSTAISSLVVVSGVSCTGKTTLIHAVATPGAASLPPNLRALDLPRHVPVNAMDPERLASAGSHVLLHYDLFRPITFHGSRCFAGDPALELLERARRIDVVTLCEPTERLRRRAYRRRRGLWRKVARRSTLRQPVRNLSGAIGAWARRRRMRPWFAEHARMRDLHRRWFDFLASAPVRSHHLVVPSRGFAGKDLDAGRPDVAFEEWETAIGLAQGSTVRLPSGWNGGD